MTSPDAGFPHRPALDGLRAVAVLAVLVFHFSNVGGGGYLGVDVFLVLSGYLITSLLALERANTGRVALVQFWIRRVRRLLPALLVLVVLVAVYARVVAPATEWSRIRDDGLATLFYVQNWHLVAAGVQTSPLSHTWSLAIEEQWYLIWPPVFLGLAWLLRGRDRLLLLVVLALALASTSEMAWLGYGDRSYYGTDTRAFALLLGAALAFLLRIQPGPRRRVSRVALEVAGLVALLGFAVIVMNPPAGMYQERFIFVAVASVCVIAAAVQDSSRLLRPLLASRPLVALGLISYGVYLYHFLVLRWMNPGRTGMGPVPLAAARFLVTVLIATVSYFLIEMPVRRGTFLPKRAQLVLAPVALAVTAVVLVITTAGAPASHTPSVAEHLYAYLRTTAPSGVRRVLLVGDRLARDVDLAMRGPSDADGIRGIGVPSTCSLNAGDTRSPARESPQCRAEQAGIRDAIAGFRPESIVVMTDDVGARWVQRTLADLRAQRQGSRVHTIVLPPPALTTASGGFTREDASAVWRDIAEQVS